MVALAETKRKDAYARWDARLRNSQKSADDQKRKVWDTLEDAIAGIFPTVIDGGAEPVGSKGRLRVSEQIDCNLVGWAYTYYASICGAGVPKFYYARNVHAERDVVKDNESVAAQLYDDGCGNEETAKGVRSSMSRGVFWLWVDVDEETVTPEAIQASAISASEFTQAALLNPGEPITIPEGADAEGIAEAAEAIIGDVDTSLGLTDEQLDSLRRLADLAKVVHLKSLEGPHSPHRRARIKFTAIPYGTWGWWDVSVTDRARIGFIWRKLVFSPEAYLASTMFNAASKRYVRARFFGGVGTGDGQGSGALATTSSTTSQSPAADLDSKDRVTVYQGWDKVNWKRIALVDGFDDFAHASDVYPFLGKDGRPVLRNFFPCSIRVPIESSVETPEGMTGTPLLEPGWPHQMEYIKVMSAYIQATKRSARQALFAPGLPKEWITAFMRGRDGSGYELPPSYDHARHGAPFVPAVWPDAPKDYLFAASEIRRSFCTAVHIAELTMTSESPNPNLGQDQLAIAGAATMQGAVLRCYESGVAEAVEIGLTLLKAFASTEEITAYLGAGSDVREPEMEDAVDPVTGAQGKKPKMVMDPTTKQPVQATKPSRVDKFRAVSLDRDRIACRFAVNVAGDTAQRVLQMQNFVALNNATLTPLGVPYKNPDPLLDQLAEMQEIHGVEPYPPDEAMRSALLQGAANGAPSKAGGGDNREAPGGGREDGRKGGPRGTDSRGPPGVPGSQERGRGPETHQHTTGIANRAFTAK